MEKLYCSYKLVFQAADGKNLVILACTVFDWSTHVTDEQRDRQTELQWLRYATAVAAVARKNSKYSAFKKTFVIKFFIKLEEILPHIYISTNVTGDRIRWYTNLKQQCNSLCSIKQFQIFYH